MELDWKTVAFEVINFVALMLLLGRFLFRPVREVMAKRREEIEAARREVEAARAETERAHADFEGRRRALEAGADAQAAAARAKGEAAAEVIVSDARASAQRLLATAEAEIEGAERRALAALGPQLVELAAAATGKLLREADAQGLTLAYTERAAAALRSSLDAAAGGPGPIAVKAWISGDADEAAVVAALRRILGPRAAIESHTEPELVAGVRLSAGGIEIEASASATIARWLAAKAEAEGGGVQAA